MVLTAPVVVTGVWRAPAPHAPRRAARCGACSVTRGGALARLVGAARLAAAPRPASSGNFSATPRRRGALLVSAALADGGDEPTPERALAPSKPVSPMGEFLNHMLSMEPHLFEEAVDAQLSRLSSDAEAAEAEANAAPSSTTDLTLYKRIEDVKRRQRSQAVQDLMYFSIMRKFADIGVDMLPPLDGGAPDFGPVNLLALTERVHSAEALELVREHLAKALGGAPGAAPPMSAMLVRMSKLQAAQMYAWSVMFGYFLRRVEARFRLERALGGGGALPRAQSQEESVAALEALFNAASAEEPDVAGAAASADAVVPSKLSLKQYVEQFDAEALGETARIVSAEGLALLDRQTSGLFGSVDALQRQMAAAVGQDARSEEELKQRIHSAIASGAVDSLTLPYTQQRRVVLEAVAFGSFLRDVEHRVSGEPALLTPVGLPGR